MGMCCCVKSMSYRDINFKRAFKNFISVGFLELRFEFLNLPAFKYMAKWRYIPLGNFGHSKVPESNSLEKYGLWILTALRCRSHNCLSGIDQYIIFYNKEASFYSQFARCFLSLMEIEFCQVFFLPLSK